MRQDADQSSEQTTELASNKITASEGSVHTMFAALDDHNSLLLTPAPPFHTVHKCGKKISVRNFY